MTRLELRSTDPADLPALAELFADRFGHGLDPADWRWKYQASVAAGGAARSMVAVSDGRVLAHSGAVAFPARLADGSERPIWQLVDWAGSTAAGSLLPPLVRLGRRFLADLPRPGDAPWVYGFPSDRHQRLGERVFGYAPSPPVWPAEGPVEAALDDRGDDGDGAGEILSIGDSFGPWAEEIWRRMDTTGIRRTADFLNWRYHARPGRYYRAVRMAVPAPERGPGARTDREEGFATFAFVGSLALVAELWLPGDELRWLPALRRAAADLAASGIERWRAWPRRHEPRRDGGRARILEALGLRPVPESLFVSQRGTPIEPFHLSMGDYDLV